MGPTLELFEQQQKKLWQHRLMLLAPLPHRGRTTPSIRGIKTPIPLKESGAEGVREKGCGGGAEVSGGCGAEVVLKLVRKSGAGCYSTTVTIIFRTASAPLPHRHGPHRIRTASAPPLRTNTRFIYGTIQILFHKFCIQFDLWHVFLNNTCLCQLNFAFICLCH